MGGTNFSLLIVLAPCPLSAATWAENVSTQISLKTLSGILRHTYPSLHSSPASCHLHPPPLPCSRAHGGGWWCAPHGGEDSRALVLLSMSVCQLFVISVCLFSLCSVAHLVCLALAVSPYGAEEAGMHCSALSVAAQTPPALLRY